MTTEVKHADYCLLYNQRKQGSYCSLFQNVAYGTMQAVFQMAPLITQGTLDKFDVRFDDN